MSDHCPACGSTGREAIDLARLQAQHRNYATETNRLLTEQATELNDLRRRLTTKDDA